MSYGEILRHTREAQGLTLREVALSTNIRRDYLQALEDEQTGRLPERTYARAYLQRYARELNLDPSPLLGAFDRTHLSRPADEPAAADPGADPPDDLPDAAPSPWDGGRSFIVAVLVALLVLVGVLL
jgi:cytoskeleton protein RodZ